MKTKLYPLTERIDPELLQEIADLLHAGQTVAFPTETVYGLGADARNEKAIARIFEAKGRPSDNPLIVHVANKEQLLELVEEVPAYVPALIDAFSPGPITYVLKSAGKLANKVTAGLDTVGIRIPDHPLALAILEASQLPIAAPSANISGRPSPTAARHVLEDLSGRIAAIVDGGPTEVGIESTVVDCSQDPPLILRPGAISAEAIAAIAGDCRLYQKDQPLKEVKSPGLKYVHYAPEVPLYLVDSEKLAETLESYRQANQRIALIYHSEAFHQEVVTEKKHLPADARLLARQLYQLLRSYSKQAVDLIVFERPDFLQNEAVLDRLERAASQIISASSDS